eukprot:5453748-Pyramimonas_sp.AAC.1
MSRTPTSLDLCSSSAAPERESVPVGKSWIGTGFGSKMLCSGSAWVSGTSFLQEHLPGQRRPLDVQGQRYWLGEDLHLPFPESSCQAAANAKMRMGPWPF